LTYTKNPTKLYGWWGFLLQTHNMLNFKRITNIQERRQAVLDDTVNSFNINTLCMKDGACHYYPNHSNTKGCAIGRLLPRNNPIIKKKLNGSVMFKEIKLHLPEWLLEMDLVFLHNLQSIHDNQTNWDENGLSKLGKKRVDEIKSLWNLK